MDKYIIKIYNEYLIIKNKKDQIGQKLTRDFALIYMNKRKKTYEKINRYLAEKNKNPSFFFIKEINNANKYFDIIKIRFLIGYLETFKPRLINEELTETLKICTDIFFNDTTDGSVVGAMEDIVNIMHLYDNKNVIPVIKKIKKIAETEKPFNNIHTVLDKVLHVMPSTKEAFYIIKSFNNSVLFKDFEQTINYLIKYYKQANLIDENLNWVG